jgi:hypothetical protein
LCASYAGSWAATFRWKASWGKEARSPFGFHGGSKKRRGSTHSCAKTWKFCRELRRSSERRPQPSLALRARDRAFSSIADFGLRIADYLISIRNPQSAIRNPK